MAMLFPIVWFRLAVEAFKESKSTGATTKGILLVIVNVALTKVFMTCVRQQVVLVNEAWLEKIEETQVAGEQYTRSCFNHSNQKIALECENLKATSLANPFTRAIYAVFMGWKTCVSIECDDLVRLVWSHYEYGILFVLVMCGLFYYFSILMSHVHEKSVIIQDYFRERETRRYLQSKYLSNGGGGGGGCNNRKSTLPRHFEDYLMCDEKM